MAEWHIPFVSGKDNGEQPDESSASSNTREQVCSYETKGTLQPRAICGGFTSRGGRVVRQRSAKPSKGVKAYAGSNPVPDSTDK